MNALSFLGPLLSSTLGARSKRHGRTLGFLAGPGGHSFVKASNLLALGGLGWAAYEIWRTSQANSARSGGSGSPGGRTVIPGTVVEGDLPPPIPPNASGARGTVTGSARVRPPAVPSVQQDLQRIVDLTLAAARADGELSEDEYGRIVASAREIGAEGMVRQAVSNPRPLNEIVGSVSERKQRETLYVYAYSIVRADEDVNAAERTWLQHLAGTLGFDAATTARLERETAYRIASMPASMSAS